MSFKINLILTLGFVLASLLIVHIECQRRRQLPPCHFKKLDDCITPLFYFTHRPESGLVINRREHALLCRTLRNTTNCVNQFFEDCGTQLSKEVFELINDIYSNRMKTFCRNGPMKNNFLEHARCLHEKVQATNAYKATCINNFQATLEQIHEDDDTDNKVGAICCGYKAWLSCSMNMAAQNCEAGQEAANALYDYLNILTGGVGEFFCASRRFDPSSKYCKRFVSSSKLRARGRNSNSVLTAGTLGLILIILGATLIWFCCQFTNKQNYNLDEETEKESISNHGLIKVNDSDSIIFMGIDPKDKDSLNAKRSLSVPSHSSFSQNNNKIKNCIYGLNSAYDVTNEKVISDLKESEIEDDEKYLSSSRCQLYSSSTFSDLDSFKNTTLLWKKGQNEPLDKTNDEQSKVNFSKKRKNRMRNDIAAAIALNKSGANPFQMPFLHKETDSLVDNEAIVVYDERTAL